MKIRDAEAEEAGLRLVTTCLPAYLPTVASLGKVANPANSLAEAEAPSGPSHVRSVRAGVPGIGVPGIGVPGV